MEIATFIVALLELIIIVLLGFWYSKTKSYFDEQSKIQARIEEFQKQQKDFLDKIEKENVFTEIGKLKGMAQSLDSLQQIHRTKELEQLNMNRTARRIDDHFKQLDSLLDIFASLEIYFLEFANHRILPNKDGIYREELNGYLFKQFDDEPYVHSLSYAYPQLSRQNKKTLNIAKLLKENGESKLSDNLSVTIKKAYHLATVLYNFLNKFLCCENYLDKPEFTKGTYYDFNGQQIKLSKGYVITIKLDIKVNKGNKLYLASFPTPEELENPKMLYTHFQALEVFDLINKDFSNQIHILQRDIPLIKEICEKVELGIQSQSILREQAS